MTLNSEITLGYSRFLHHIWELPTDEVARIGATLIIRGKFVGIDKRLMGFQRD